MSNVQIRAIPVIRYVLTKFDDDGQSVGSTPLGEFDNAKHVNYVGGLVATAAGGSFEAAPALKIRWADEPSTADEKATGAHLVMTDNHPSL